MKSVKKKWKSAKKRKKVKENILHELRQFFWHENCWALNPDGPQMLQVDAEINILEPPGQGWQGQLGRRI